MGGGKSIFILHWMFDIRLGLSLEKGFKQYVHSILLYCQVQYIYGQRIRGEYETCPKGFGLKLAKLGLITPLKK